MKGIERLDAIERQVYACFDGPDGLIIQTSISTYNNYYKRLGWVLMGRAQPLTGFKTRTYLDQVKLEEDEPELEPDEDTIGNQQKLL